ncbi:MAG TPA: response regulator, partial [Anaerovoracaceae bacterium]|nr:response regulator [Anaerovoracaceae bacterium]
MYKALLVDDREIFIMELERLRIWGNASGLEVAGRAPNGVEALRLLRANAYDLVITDIRMPKLDGIGLLQEIKKEDLCPCVVLLSEHSEFEYARSGLVLGAFDYLIKPVEEQKIEQLLFRVRGFLDASGGEPHKLPQESEEESGRYYYPAAEEKNILSMLDVQNERIPEVFHDAAKRLEQLLKPGEPRYDSIVRKLYLNIVSALFDKHSWLTLYTTVEQYENPKTWRQSENSEADALRDVLSDLLGRVEKLAPVGVHNTIHEVCGYILENPESEISLSSI